MRISHSALGRLSVLALAASIAACTDRTGAQPASYPTANPLAASATVTSSTTSTVAYPLIGSGGVDVAGILPTASAAVAVTETTSVTPFAGVTAFAVKRAAAAARKTSALTDTPIDYVEFTDTTPVTLAGIPALAFTLPSITSGASYYLAIDEDGTFVPVSGPTGGSVPGSVSGNTVSFAAGTEPGTLTPTTPLILVLYAETGTNATATPSASPSAAPTSTPTAVPTATPTAVPTASPTPTPTPIAIVASPSALAFDQGNPGQVETVNVSYNGSATTLSTVLNCSPAPAPTPTTIATPTPGYDFVASITSGPTTPALDAQVTLQGGDDFGTCVLTISDGLGTSTTVSVETDASNITISGKHRK